MAQTSKEQTILRGVAGSIAGLGAIYLAAQGVIAPEAATAILASLIAFFVGEYNGIRVASKTQETE